MECILALALVVAVFAYIAFTMRKAAEGVSRAVDTHGKTAARDALIERYTEASMVDLDVDPDSEGGFIFDADLDDMTARFEITEYGHEPKHYLLRRRDNGSWRMKYTTETAERLIAERAERWETRPQFVQDKLAETAEEDLPAFRVSARKWQRLGAEQEHELERCWRVREELRPLIHRLAVGPLRR